MKAIEAESAIHNSVRKRKENLRNNVIILIGKEICTTGVFKEDMRCENATGNFRQGAISGCTGTDGCAKDVTAL